MNVETLTTLLPHVTSKHIPSLARQTGITPHQVREHAKRINCDMQPRSSAREFSIAEDRVILRHEDETASQLIGCGKGPVAARRRYLNDRRAARAGTWSDDELFAALYGTPPSARPHHETMIRRLQAGITTAAQDAEVTLQDAASGLGIEVTDLIVAALNRHLALADPLTDEDVPSASTRTSMRRVGAWIIAFPSLIGPNVDGAFLTRTLLLCGVAIGKQV